MSQSDSLLQRILDQAERTPEAVALRRCDGASALRYRQLAAESRRLANELRSAPVRRGDRVLVISDNGPETYLAVLACAHLGAIAVMVDRKLPRAAYQRCAQITDPAAIVVTPEAARQVWAWGDAPVLSAGIGVGTYGDSFRTVAAGADDPLAMVFTSGTTGEPKAVVLGHRTFYAVADLLAAADLDWVDWVVGETTYSPLPATHIGGLWWILNCLAKGCQCVVGGEYTTSLLQLLTDNDVATTCVVPFLLGRLVAEAKSTGAALPSSLRLLGYGGSRAVADDVAFVEIAGVRTAQVYGLSETGCTAMCLPTEPGSISRISSGAVGRPYPGVQVRLDVDCTLWIRSPANMLGYWNNPEQTDRVLADGWVNTGDLFDLGEDGFYYIRGRASELFISGGTNVVPDEVDRIAGAVPGVRDAACFEIPDDDFGALVGLAVVASADLDEIGVRKLKQTIAARYRSESETIARPARIDLVSNIPRTQSGKVMRTSLATSILGG
ncbi:fatty acid--CoA ligase FadD10 [Mycolicibacterium neoaurum]|uniref:fatty acid--CoA ligase FadD10 n=1 Tax=Mycolicibacterium neoaurum TaxID=1795 RepID=UPI00248C48AB|nr:fatty acid--CoA ligase FadD10 [Mycolicibacterium neoaurum]WBP92742.1 fatty acid--CoA ligase FadD10 [Mycolicibacterium neoaurum]WBS06304.1 fatty acid--CoA ligase FadD10 [Mycolicibacterium neoaurum]